MADAVVPFIASPFTTKVAWEAYAALPPEKRLLHPAIMSSRLGVPVAQASFRDASKMGGMSCDIKFIDVVLATGDTVAMVLKTAAGSPLRAAMGCAREALFYQEFAPQLMVAKCFWAQGNMETGEAHLLLEALEDAVPSGVFFGAAQPNNWAIKDKLETLCAGNPPPEVITVDAFKLYACMHATFWEDGTLLSKPWLRGAGWAAGEGEARWMGAQAQAKGAWAKIRSSISSGESPLVWDPHLVACLDASFAKVDWEAYQMERKAHPFTLVHGDAHAHNFLWIAQRTPEARQLLIDFEMIGVGPGAQELGQYVISHVSPQMRRARARAWVDGYHAELLAELRSRGHHDAADAYTADMCFGEYVAGGAGRWVWFVPVLIAMGLPAPMNQYFHDQLAAFLHDHIEDPAASPIPRV